ncbi:hypothetical protein ACQ86E_20555 [Bradyrhizobium betae]|uniref:hypothetical protein n=1 Tax=Bradyrhizobium betae TaxID=244734 RepID=UPI003D666026
MLKLDLVKEEMRNPVAAAEAVGRMPGRADLSPSPTVANELVAHLCAIARQVAGPLRVDPDVGATSAAGAGPSAPTCVFH